MADPMQGTVFPDDLWQGETRSESQFCREAPWEENRATFLRRGGGTHGCPTDGAAGQKYI